jgi:hypothetical protein
MQRFASVQAGIDAMRVSVLANKQKVCALLSFQLVDREQTSSCFLFESVEGPAAQLIKLYPDKLTVSGFARADVGLALQARDVAIRAELRESNARSPGSLGEVQHGHAEEFLIDAFVHCAGQVGPFTDVDVYVSHSPCTVFDDRPSDQLVNWPESCTAKFERLAATYPKYEFTVFFFKAFGCLAGKTVPDDRLRSLTAGAPNLDFVSLAG